jgi:hypothetical protein
VAADLPRGRSGPSEWRPGASVEKQPPSDKRVHLKYGLDDLAAHCARVRHIPPEER